MKRFATALAVITLAGCASMTPQQRADYQRQLEAINQQPPVVYGRPYQADQPARQTLCVPSGGGFYCQTQ